MNFFFFWLMLFPLRGRFGIHLAFGKIIFKVQLEPPPNVWPVRVALSFTCGLITSSSATFSTKTNLKASDSLGEVEQSAFRTSDETLADESALRRRDLQFHIFVNMLAVNLKKKKKIGQNRLWLDAFRPTFHRISIEVLAELNGLFIGCLWWIERPSHFSCSFSRIEWVIRRIIVVKGAIKSSNIDTISNGTDVHVTQSQIIIDTLD